MRYQVIEIIHKVNIIEADSEKEAIGKFYERYTESEISHEDVEVHHYETAADPLPPKTMRTPEQIKALQLACLKLNSFRKRKGHAWAVTPDDLLTLQEAQEQCDKPALREWSDLSVFIPATVAVRLYASMTHKGRDLFITGEVLGGWFESDDALFDDEGKCVNGDEVTCDIDGEFCSTPSHGSDVPSVEDYADDIDNCSRDCLLFVYSA